MYNSRLLTAFKLEQKAGSNWRDETPVQTLRTATILTMLVAQFQLYITKKWLFMYQEHYVDVYDEKQKATGPSIVKNIVFREKYYKKQLKIWF